jgi:hypothetical protein
LSSEAILQTSRLLVGRDTSNPICFTIYNYHPTPRLFANFVLPKVCFTSGAPLFALIIEFSASSNKTFTVNKSHTPLSSREFVFHGVKQLLDCEDVETGNGVYWPTTFGCFDDDSRPAFPDKEDGDFVDIEPNQVWRFEYTTRRSSELVGLGRLETARSYVAQLGRYKTRV